MTALAARRSSGALSIVLIVASIARVGGDLARDGSRADSLLDRPLGGTLVGSAALFNVTCVLQSLVGGIIEWRRPGHAIGRLLLLSGPLYALLAAGWGTASLSGTAHRPAACTGSSTGADRCFRIRASRSSSAWVPLLFPTGTLPGPLAAAGWTARGPVSSIGLVAWAVQPELDAERSDPRSSPIGIEGWPPILGLFVDAIPLELLALIALAVAGLITALPARRSGSSISRSAGYGRCCRQLRGRVRRVLVEFAIRHGRRPARLGVRRLRAASSSMPIAIGIAVTRYRSYEIDRLISRTSGGRSSRAPARVYAATVVGLQALLAGVHPGPDPGRGRLDAPRLRALPARPRAGPDAPSTAASTGRATTATERPPPLPSACGNRSTSPGSRAISPARSDRRFDPRRSDVWIRRIAHATTP